MDINKYFDNYLDITTKDGKIIHIEKINWSYGEKLPIMD